MIISEAQRSGAANDGKMILREVFMLEKSITWLAMEAEIISIQAYTALNKALLLEIESDSTLTSGIGCGSCAG